LKKNSDIIIIGAGPAGTATSLFLANAGIAHTIIEKQSFPRDKICGDALSGKSV
jgi:flavin-dependent dehydrogenase